MQRLLGLLDADPVKAQVRYNGMRERLERLFERYESTRCDAGRYADETIDRLILQLSHNELFRPANILTYAAGIARMVVKESYRLPRFGASPAEFRDVGEAEEVSTADQLMMWLEYCLDALPQKDHKLIIEYYAREGRAKSDWRQAAAAEMSKSEGTFRVTVFRIRKRLQKCVEERRRAEGE